jgi:23S rRNA (uracil1939-C5)-methyltransferase
LAHCVHYGVCGGCAADDPFTIDKRGMLAAALAKAGFADPPVAALVNTPLRTRRRADLGVTRKGVDIALGLHRARSHEVVDMTECVLLDPRIFALLAPLRVLLRSLEALRREGSVVINLLDEGPDLLFRMDADFSAPDRRRLIEFARTNDATRVSVAPADGEPELLAVLRRPVVTLSGIAVEPPPGAFMQASAAGEAAIIAAVLAGLPKLAAKARILELYAGIGTLGFALVPRARVAAFEGAADAANAQDKAIRASNLAGRMSVDIRDLARRPLQTREFAGAAAVVLDPPYAGAGPQMRFLAAAAVPRIIYVSCNPAALAVDLSVLTGVGYKMLAATPFDQFPYSENVESVVVLEMLK